jgi:(p)ppGpp synthase/HD superfamily hydrolase
MCYIFFLIFNVGKLSHKIFEKNTNKIIDVIDNNLIHNNNHNNHNNLNNHNNHNNLNIYYEKRIKSKERIISKLQKFKIPYDIYGLRIIYNDDDYYNIKTAYVIKNIIYDNFYTFDFISDDYIAKPKKNNYQSLHLYIICNLLIEVQIRNTNMHNISVNGSASNYYL